MPLRAIHVAYLETTRTSITRLKPLSMLCRLSLENDKNLDYEIETELRSLDAHRTTRFLKRQEPRLRD